MRRLSAQRKDCDEDEVVLRRRSCPYNSSQVSTTLTAVAGCQVPRYPGAWCLGRPLRKPVPIRRRSPQHRPLGINSSRFRRSLMSVPPVI